MPSASATAAMPGSVSVACSRDSSAISSMTLTVSATTEINPNTR